MSRILQVAGMVAITAGVIWLSVPAGLIVAGVFLVLVGISVAE
jgi:hypothetical protein